MVDSSEIKRLAAEVSVQHGIRVDPDDPIMAVATLNRLMLEHVMANAASLIGDATQEFNRATERVQIRAGSVVAQEVREAVASIRTEIQKDIESARLNARELIDELHQTQLQSRRWWGSYSGSRPVLVSLPLACSRECSCAKVEGADHSRYASLCYFLSQPEPTRSPRVWVHIRFPALVRSPVIQQFSLTAPGQ